MKDLRRFQNEKEEDLRRYMVSNLTPLITVCMPNTDHFSRWNLHNVTLTGQNATRQHGKKQEPKSRTLCLSPAKNTPGRLTISMHESSSNG